MATTLYYIDDGSGLPKYYAGRNIIEALAYVNKTYGLISYRGTRDGFTAECINGTVECGINSQRK